MESGGLLAWNRQWNCTAGLVDEGLVKRTTSGPVMLVPSAFLATGTVMVDCSAVGMTSPCQPLTSVTWPLDCHGLPAAAVDDRYPDTPLDFVMSTGFTIVKVAMYSTLPFALRGASLISVMMAFLGSLGSSSP